MTYLAQKEGGAVARVDIWPVDRRIASALLSYVRYLRLMFWPKGLAVFYPLSFADLTAEAVTWAVIVLLIITALFFFLRRKEPYLLMGWLWFLGMLVPVIGIVQVGGQAVADRYLYLPF